MRKGALTAAIAMAALIVACGGKGGDKADRDFSEEELAAMVLPLEEMGDQYAGFEASDDNGFESNQHVIDDAFDQEDEKADLERFGRINGYSASYESTAAVLEGEGIYMAGTDVELLSEAKNVSGYVADFVDDWKASVGETDEGATLEQANEFNAGKIGQEARGFFYEISYAAPEGSEPMVIRGALIVFRKGRLMGGAIVLRMDDAATRDDTVALAQKVDARIDAVINGEVQAQPQAHTDASPKIEPKKGLYPTDVLSTFKYSSEVTIAAGKEINYRSEGDFQGPSTTRCVETASVGGATYSPTQIVVSEEQAWVDEGDGKGFKSIDSNDSEFQDDLDDCLGSPLYWQHWDYYWLLRSDIVAPESQTIEGLPTRHYSLADSVGRFVDAGLLPEAWGKFDMVVFDLWFAEDGEWPVAFDLDMSGTAGTFERAGMGGLSDDPDAQIRMAMNFKITNANDPSIIVQLPES